MKRLLGWEDLRDWQEIKTSSHVDVLLRFDKGIRREDIVDTLLFLVACLFVYYSWLHVLLPSIPSTRLVYSLDLSGV